MRARRLAGFRVLTAALGVLVVVGACGKAPVPGEHVTSNTLPPITICYEPDGAPCPPLDAGDDAASDAGDAGEIDAPEAGPG